MESFYANLILLFVALIIYVSNYSRFTRLEAYPGRTAFMILIISIAIGVYMMSYFGLESILTNKRI
jgi:purine-cytosine permease-like protein